MVFLIEGTDCWEAKRYEEADCFILLMYSVI